MPSDNASPIRMEMDNISQYGYSYSLSTMFEVNSTCKWCFKSFRIKHFHFECCPFVIDAIPVADG